MQIDMEIFKGFTVFLSRKKKKNTQQEFDSKKDSVVVFKWGVFPQYTASARMGWQSVCQYGN